MKVLFTTPILDYPATGGPQLRIENSIKALASVCELDVLYRTYDLNEKNNNKTKKYFENIVNEYHTISRSKPDSFISNVKFQVERFSNKLFGTRISKEAESILKHVEQRNIDIIWFGFGNISYPLIKKVKKLRPDIKVVCDTDSVWSRFVLRELPYTSGLRKLHIKYQGSKKQQEEKSWVQLCDVTTAVSSVDAEYYQGLSNTPDKVHLFSNVIDIKNYNVDTPPPADFKKPSIFLAGSFGHYNSPMDNAARWVLDEVLPLIHKSMPNVHFYIVGNHSDVSFGHFNSDRITVTGRVDSVLPYLCNVDAALVPLKYESGTRFKILEAGACKVPIVSTTLGAEGIPVKHKKHLLIADDARSFADAVISLLSDDELVNNLTRNCYELVTKFNSVDSLAQEAVSILEYLKDD